MNTIFDGDLSIEELAFALGLANELIEEERYQRPVSETETLVPEEGAKEWFED